MHCRLFVSFFVGIALLFYTDACASSFVKKEKPPLETFVQDIEIKFANVGQGNGVFLQNHANGKVLIIDAGFSSRPAGVLDGKALADRLLQFLTFSSSNQLESVTQPYIVIVSHPDKDHVNLLNQFCAIEALSFLANVQGFYLGGDLSHYIKRDSRALLEYLKVSPLKTNIKILSHAIAEIDAKSFLNNFLSKTMTIDPDTFINERRPYIKHLLIDYFLHELQVAQGARLEFLSINAYSKKSHTCADENSYHQCLAEADVQKGNDLSDSEDSINGSSALVRLSFGDVGFIFTGDANGITMQRNINEVDSSKLKARILLASHHGSDEHETNSKEWAAMTQPEIIVFSAGFYGRYNHPRFQAVVNYLEYLRGRNVQNHRIILHNTGDYIANISTLNDLGVLSPIPVEGHAAWVSANTERSIYTTSCPPAGHDAISFTVNIKGDVINYPPY